MKIAHMAIAILLLLAGGFALAEDAGPTPEQPANPNEVRTHSIDDVFAIVSTLQGDYNQRMTVLEDSMMMAYMMSVNATMSKMDEQHAESMAVENQEKAYIEERTNPLRTNLLTLVFLSLIVLYVGKRVAEEQWLYLREGVPKCPVCSSSKEQREKEVKARERKVMQQELKLTNEIRKRDHAIAVANQRLVRATSKSLLVKWFGFGLKPVPAFRPLVIKKEKVSLFNRVFSRKAKPVKKESDV